MMGNSHPQFLHSTMNQLFYNNSGPNSLLYEDNMMQLQHHQNSPQLPPRTPQTSHRTQKTPVMGTKSFHRRTNSNASSQHGSGSNRNSFQCSSENAPMSDFNYDYRFHNFDMNHRENFEFHSLPYDSSSNITNALSPNRVRIYENLSHFQMQTSPAPSSLPITTTPSYSSSNRDEAPKIPSTIAPTNISNISLSNAEKRKMFFNVDSSPSSVQQNSPVTSSQKSKFVSNGDQLIVSEANNVNNGSAKVSNSSTGCTPTHSTPQDSFSDDSSYLSALSRLRLSPDNFLDEGLTLFSPTSRYTIANMQRAMVKRTMELEDNENS